MTGREKLDKFKYVISGGVCAVKILPRGIRKFLFVSFRGISGNIGVLLRYILLKSIANIGSNVTIFENVYLKNPEKFTCGNNVSIHSMCYIEASGNVTLGNDVSLAHGVSIMSESHSYSDKVTPIKYQPMLMKHTILGNNVWVGAKSTILYGLTIADGSVIGANSVVTHNTEKDSINVGCPSKFIKKRIK
ncbi:MAG: acyltransferase [Muribaculum sp.]|nr:acyltransferase [Muribaculum sp.]